MNDNKNIIEEFKLYDGEIAFFRDGRTAFITNATTAVDLCKKLNCSLGELSGKSLKSADLVPAKTNPVQVVTCNSPYNNGKDMGHSALSDIEELRKLKDELEKSCCKDKEKKETFPGKTYPGKKTSDVTKITLLDHNFQDAFVEDLPISELCENDYYPKYGVMMVIDSTGRLFTSRSAAEKFYGLCKGTVSRTICKGGVTLVYPMAATGEYKVPKCEAYSAISFAEVDSYYSYYIYRSICTRSRSLELRSAILHLANKRAEAASKVAKYLASSYVDGLCTGANPVLFEYKLA